MEKNWGSCVLKRLFYQASLCKMSLWAFSLADLKIF